MKFRSCLFMFLPQGGTMRICRFQALPHVSVALGVPFQKLTFWGFGFRV